MPSNTIIVHLSDIHFGAFFNYRSIDAKTFDNEIVRAIQTAYKSKIIQTERRLDNSNPKYLFCTGDLTSRGAEEPMREGTIF